MLGSRTKQINSYGKRSQRIVSVSQSESGNKASIFDDLPPTRFAPVASRMKKKSENPVSSPKQRLVHKKKQSPLGQPLRQKLMRAQVDRQVSTSKLDAEATPTRRPLAMYPLNTPGSPAVLSNVRRKKARVSTPIRTPLITSHADVVEVDIIVLDDQGKTISRERRVSKGKVAESASPNSESDREAAPKHPMRLKKVKPIDSSDDEPMSPPISKISKVPLRSKLSIQPSRVLSHVLIPPSSLDPAFIIPTKTPQPSSPLPRPLVDYDLAHVVKPRKLTPIRGRGKGLFCPPSPPSPLTDSDFDLSLDFNEMMSLDADGELENSSQPPPVIPSYLRSLLEECQQSTTGLHEFSAFIETFAFDSAVRGSLPAKNLRFKKVGEASYSEVFGIGDVVLKVIPLRDENGVSMSSSQKARLSNGADLPAPTDAKDVLKEIIVTRAMGEVCEPFVKLVKSYVVRGRYPEVLLELWDQYEQEHGSESVRPDAFSVSQAYAIIVLPNGGPDLEAYTFSNASKRWRQACSVFWQVAKALARAEQLVSFEHRDLHLGQILIKDLPSTVVPMQQQKLNTPARSHLTKASMDDPNHGVQVTLIDLGLARMDAGDGDGGEIVHWTPFDAEVFMGEGDYQFDVYRMMKELNKDDWQLFNPSTNVMWLHYVLVKLLRSKGLRAPAPARQGTQPPASHFTERQCYECMVDLEQWLAQFTVPILAKTQTTKKRKKLVVPKTITSDLPPLCAGEIVEYGIKKRWVKPWSNL
ncbi:hypothetical protein BDP27DRAFT_1209735 [Rhodocollybia butyracea]|uniref:non-specific serine/threonine protein kinase n=1 Tax=Rhodocollybia butyracea TaxID=206335 RepID=A0A9P5UF78_9AGAR|nr:hypothetical protein BDP27DRAFT_1209735 [Rhodocollybia butyracea]